MNLFKKEKAHGFNKVTAIQLTCTTLQSCFLTKSTATFNQNFHSENLQNQSSIFTRKTHTDLKLVLHHNSVCILNICSDVDTIICVSKFQVDGRMYYKKWGKITNSLVMLTVYYELIAFMKPWLIIPHVLNTNSSSRPISRPCDRQTVWDYPAEIQNHKTSCCWSNREVFLTT